MSSPVLSVITPTLSNRPGLLHCLAAVEAQTLAGIEHIVVSDGPDPHAEAMCRHTNTRYLALSRRMGDRGRSALDAGLRASTAPYVVFWYDSNLYPPEAAYTLWSVAAGHDIGIARIHYWSVKAIRMVRIPDAWDGTIRVGNIDAANCCVRRKLFSEKNLYPSTVAPGSREADGILWVKLQEAGATIRVTEEVALTYVARQQEPLGPMPTPKTRSVRVTS